MDKYIGVAKVIVKAVVVTGVTATLDSFFCGYTCTKPGNTVDSVLRKVGVGSIGIVVGNKAADSLIETAEALYDKHNTKETE